MLGNIPSFLSLAVILSKIDFTIPSLLKSSLPTEANSSNTARISAFIAVISSLDNFLDKFLLSKSSLSATLPSSSTNPADNPVSSVAHIRVHASGSVRPVWARTRVHRSADPAS